MADDAQQPAAGGEAAGRTDPWAAPAEGTPDRGAGPGATIASGEPLTWPEPPSVHDQQTVTSMPAMGGGTPPQGTPPQGAAPGAPASAPGYGTPSTPSPPGAPASAPGFGTPSSAPVPGSVPPPAPAGPWATPAAPPQASGPAYGGSFAAPPHSAGGPANPFAAPDEAVPPPPIAPGGPGQVPYGYPGGSGGGYGYPGPAAGQTGYGAAAQQQGYYGWGAVQLPNNGLGTAGLVLGIISAAVFCLWPVAIVVGVLAVIFGSVGRAKVSRGEATNGGQALAGIICGAVGILLGVGFGLLVLLG